MPNKIVNNKFYFPETSHTLTNKQEFVDLIVEKMRKDGGIKYAGYLKEKDLKNDLLRYFKNENITPKELSTDDKQAISNTIDKTVGKCHEVLHHPDPPIFVYVYPWFPNTKSQTLFRGVTAFTGYYTMHLFIDLNTYTKSSLEQTIVHEWNHLVFYRYHAESPYTLLTHIIMEGFAEVFREELVGGEPAPWSLALTETESLKQLGLLEKYFDVDGLKLYCKIFFGNKEFKKWTGYSIGYKLVKEFRKKHPGLSWEEIIKSDPKDIFITIKNEAQ